MLREIILIRKKLRKEKTDTYPLKKNVFFHTDTNISNARECGIANEGMEQKKTNWFSIGWTVAGCGSDGWSLLISTVYDKRA